MHTENLNAMIQQVPSIPVNDDGPDRVYTLHKEKWEYDDDVRNDASNTEKPTKDSMIPHQVVNQTTDIIASENTDVVEVNTDNYQPESEEELIAHTMEIHKTVQNCYIGGYWEIGRSINSYYRGKYGVGELERIANATGIGGDTLNKMCKFANQYSSDQIKALLSGAYPISWFQISQNLTVEPDKLIQVYQDTGNPKQFHNDIMKFKNPKESRGKSKTVSLEIPESVAEPSIINEVTEAPVVTEIQSEKIPAIMVSQASNDHLKKIEDLQLENKKLRKELDHREYQVNQLQELFHDSALDNDSKNRLIEKLKATLKQVYGMIENGYDHVNMLSEIDWRILK